MNIYIGFVLAAAIAVVYSTKCMHNDTSMCMDLNCTDPNMVVGCEHDVCTCVMASGGNGGDMSCMDKADCAGREHDLHCKHDETAHCLDRMCTCMKDHHG